MAGVKAGSVDAFGVLYDRFSERAYRVARSVCRDEGRAQEAVQETFISIWRTRTTYEDKGRVAPWVLTVARHRAIDIARSNGLHAARLVGDDELLQHRAPIDVLEQVAARAEVRDLRRRVARLPDMQREVVTLAFYGQLTHDEIAARLDLPLGTVKGRVRLGLQRLRTDIREADHQHR